MSENYILKINKDIEIKFKNQPTVIENLQIKKNSDKATLINPKVKEIKVNSITLKQTAFGDSLSKDVSQLNIKIDNIEKINCTKVFESFITNTAISADDSPTGDAIDAHCKVQPNEEQNVILNTKDIERLLEGELKLNIDWSRSWFSNESEVWISEAGGIKLDENNIEEIKKEMFITNAYPHIWWIIPVILLIALGAFLAYWYFIWNKEEISEDEKNEEDLITETI